MLDELCYVTDKMTLCAVFDIDRIACVTGVSVSMAGASSQDAEFAGHLTLAYLLSVAYPEWKINVHACHYSPSAFRATIAVPANLVASRNTDEANMQLENTVRILAPLFLDRANFSKMFVVKGPVRERDSGI